MFFVIVIVEAAIQFLIIKFAFIKTNSDGSFQAAFSHMQAHGATEEPYLHLRNFMPNF